MTNIKKISKQENKLKFRLFFSYILFTLVIFMLVIVLNDYFIDKKSALIFNKNFTIENYEKKRYFHDFFENQKLKIKAISQNSYLLQYATDGSNKAYVKALLYTFIEANNNYMQLTFIDENGFEKLKFYRNKNLKKVIPSTILKDRSNSDYFKALKISPKKKVYTSFNSDMKSIIEVATPIYFKKNFRGCLIINVSIEKPMKKFITSKSKNDIKIIISILIFSIFMALIFSTLFSKWLKKIYVRLVEQNSQLSKNILKLEKNIEEEINKNSEKDRLIENKNKLIKTEYIIIDIALQWRQSLSELSSVLKDKMTKKRVDFMLSTIDNFIDFYKNDKKRKEFYISDSLEFVLKTFEPIFKQNNIDIEIKNDSSMMIFGNKNQFAYVLITLITNVKAIFQNNRIKSASIKIFIEDNDDNIIIKIYDNAGIIKEENLKNIFEPSFYIKEKKDVRVGLYLSKGIIEDEFHGQLLVENIENGVCFTIII